jgi:hypothetical protein
MAARPNCCDKMAANTGHGLLIGEKSSSHHMINGAVIMATRVEKKLERSKIRCELFTTAEKKNKIYELLIYFLTNVVFETH